MCDALPDWLIDDTAKIGEARVFAVHTASPRLIGELVPDSEFGASEFRDDIAGITLEASPGWTLCRVQWIDPPAFDADALCRSLRAAIERHDAIRNNLSGGGDA